MKGFIQMFLDLGERGAMVYAGVSTPSSNSALPSKPHHIEGYDGSAHSAQQYKNENEFKTKPNKPNHDGCHLHMLSPHQHHPPATQVTWSCP